MLRFVGQVVLDVSQDFLGSCPTLQMARIFQNVNSDFPKSLASCFGRYGPSASAPRDTPTLRKLQSVTLLEANQATCCDISLACNSVFVFVDIT